MHLTAARNEDASRAATLLTDAFSTASLPGADDGRMVVIRRLPLGRIPIHVSPATLALHIERTVRHVVAQAVPFDSPAAASAGAVIFPDRAAPLVALARLHARRAPTDAWFWRAFLPRWAACATRLEQWLLLFETVHALPEAAIVAAAMVNQSVAAGAERELLSAIPPGGGAAWLRSAGWRSFDPADQLRAADETVSLPLVAIARMIEHVDAVDDRVIWLTTMLVVHAARARVGDPSLPAMIAHAIRRTLPAPEVPRANASGARASETRQTTDRVSVSAPLDEFTSRQHDEPEAGAPPARIQSDERTIDVISEIALGGFFTSYAGVFLLVAILTHLRFGAFVAARREPSDQDFPMRLLRFIATRLGLTADDPLTALFNTSRDADLVRRDRDVHTMWLSAVRQWCKRHRIPLRTLVRRPGRVHATAMHVDVIFDLAQLDIRVRRLAIDVDPGWVPWLGRVVAFHYTNPGEEREHG
jgi:hypothetical protein